VAVTKYCKLCDFFQHVTGTARPRRARVDYTRAEEKLLEIGVKKFGHQWTKILRKYRYKFHSQRTAADLKEKWTRMLKKVCVISVRFDFYVDLSVCSHP